MLSVVHSESIPGPQHQLLQVQSQWPRVLRVQSPHTEQWRAPDGWRREGPIEGLVEASAGPLNGSGRHDEPSVSLQLLSIHLGLLLLPVVQQLPQRISLGPLISSLLSVRVAIVVIVRLSFVLFLLCAAKLCGLCGFVASLFVGADAGAFIETLHAAVTAPRERKAAAAEALEGRHRAFARVWMCRNRMEQSHVKQQDMWAALYERRRTPRCRTSGIVQQKR